MTTKSKSEKFVDHVFRCQRTYQIIGFVLLILFVTNAFRLKINENLLDLLPTENHLVADYKNVLNHFNPLDKMYVNIVATDDQVNPDKMLAIGDAIYDDLKSSNFFHEISYKWNVEDVTGVIDVFRNHRAALFTRKDRETFATKTSPSNIDSVLKYWRKLLIESPAPFLADAFYKDPIGLDEPLMKKLKSIQSFGSSMTTYKGRLFSKNMKQLLIIAPPKSPSTESKFTKDLVKYMTDLTARYSHDGVRVGYIGAHRYALANETEMKRDVGLASTLSTLGILGLAFLVFRRKLLPLLILCPVLFGAATAMGMVPFFFSQTSLIAIGCGSILFGIAVDYGVHILFHIDSLNEPNTANVKKMMSQLIVPLTLSALTTIIAFLCLQSSLLPSYQQFGAFAAFGIIGALFFALFLLPPMLLKLKPSNSLPKWQFMNFFSRFFASIQSARTPWLIFIICLTLFCILGLRRITFDGELDSLYTTSNDIKQDQDTLNDAFGDAMNSTSAVIVAKNLQAALKTNDLLHQELKKLQKNGSIKSFSSLAELLPSDQAQRAHIESWQGYWDQSQIQKLDQTINKVGKQNRLRPEYFKPFVDSLSADHKLLSINDYQGTFLESMFKTQVSQSEQVMILSNIKLVDPGDFVAIKESLGDKFVNLISINGRHFVGEMVKIINSELKRLGLYAFICIALLLASVYGLRFAIPMLCPLILSIVWTLGFMGWLGLSINIMNCVIVLFVFGLVIDYSVFLCAAFRHQQTHNDPTHLNISSGAISISAVTTLLGVGALSLANHPALKTVGLTTLIGILCGLTAVMLFVPLTIKSVRR